MIFRQQGGCRSNETKAMGNCWRKCCCSKKRRENKRQTDLEHKGGIDGCGCVQRRKAHWGEKSGRRHKNITDSVSRPGLRKDVGFHCQEMSGDHL